MKKKAYSQGMIVSYDHSLDQDGYDVVKDVSFDDTITVVDGTEYVIADNAPSPIVYGVEKQLISVDQVEGKSSVYTYYNHKTAEYIKDVPVPDVWDEGAATCCPGSNNEHKGLRKLVPHEFLETKVYVNTMPTYNFRPRDEG